MPYQILSTRGKELGINFAGNVEGRDAFSGKIDAILTDGFTGNVFLKTVEGFGKLVKRNLTESLKKNVFTLIGTIPALPMIKKFSKTMDYKQYGGALFLGVKKPGRPLGCGRPGCSKGLSAYLLYSFNNWLK